MKKYLNKLNNLIAYQEVEVLSRRVSIRKILMNCQLPKVSG